MSTLNLSEDLFLGKAELQKLIDFIDNYGYKKLLVDNSYSFGIIRAGDDSDFDNFKVESGTNVGTIKIATNSYALDENGNVIYKEAEDNIAIPNDNQYYWVKIKYEVSVIEEGTVSVDNQGNLTGSGTKFTEVLRGMPNHPSRIKFTDGSLNTQEYEVQEVISDTSAVLLGVFQSELNLHYGVVGTFTPGVYPEESEKYPFQHDNTIGINVSDGGLVLETVLNTPPSKTEGEEFYIARVKRNGSTLTIEDKRIEFWKIKSDYDLSYIDRDQVNSLIGVESIKYDNQVSTRDHNEIKIGWGMRSSNWVVNSELRRVTFVSADESGKYKSVSDFTNGDFDGWRIYANDGSYKKVISSVLSGGQINMVLDSLDPDDYSSGDELIIVPDVEEIQLKFRRDAYSNLIDNVETIFTFPISQGYAAIKVLVPGYLEEDESEVDLNNATYSYNIVYRYKTFNQYTEWSVLPSDIVNGYYDETSFDNNGILRSDPVDRNRKTYTSHEINGYIEFIVNARSYYQVLSRLDRGDLFGVDIVDLSDSGNNPLYTIQVGISKQVIIFEGTNSLSVDWFINLLDGELSQNEFFLFFRNTITLGGFHLRIVENYISTSEYDELIDFDIDLVARAGEENLMVRCTWDGTNWQLFKHISEIDLDTKLKNRIPYTTYNISSDGTYNLDSLQDYIGFVSISGTGGSNDCVIIELPTPSISNRGRKISFLINCNWDPLTIRIESGGAIIRNYSFGAYTQKEYCTLMCTGSTWVMVFHSYLTSYLSSIYLDAASNLSDVASASTARSNIAALSNNPDYIDFNNYTSPSFPVEPSSTGRSRLFFKADGTYSGSTYYYRAYVKGSWVLGELVNRQGLNEGLACPFVYVKLNNNWIFYSEIMENQSYMYNDKIHELNISKKYIKDGKLKIKLVEEKDEITYLDSISVSNSIVNICPNNLERNDKYIVLRKGEELILEFDVDKVEDLVLISKGYYVPLK